MHVLLRSPAFDFEQMRQQQSAKPAVILLVFMEFFHNSSPANQLSRLRSQSYIPKDIKSTKYSVETTLTGLRNSTSGHFSNVTSFSFKLRSLNAPHTTFTSKCSHFHIIFSLPSSVLISNILTYISDNHSSGTSTSL